MKVHESEQKSKVVKKGKKQIAVILILTKWDENNIKFRSAPSPQDFPVLNVKGSKIVSADLSSQYHFYCSKTKCASNSNKSCYLNLYSKIAY